MKIFHAGLGRLDKMTAIARIVRCTCVVRGDVSEEFGGYVLAWKDGNSIFLVSVRYSLVAEGNVKQTVSGKRSVSESMLHSVAHYVLTTL
jgi:hypothetical protein